jgi:hypothetical protein
MICSTRQPGMGQSLFMLCSMGVSASFTKHRSYPVAPRRDPRKVRQSHGFACSRVQYASEPYRAVLERHGITQSMSRRGNCLDNAPMESLFAALKVEHVHQVRFRTRAEARTAVFEYIEIFYNRQRLHSGLGYRTPAEARASMEGVTMLAAA